MNYLFIDGNNLAIRCAFANSTMVNKENISSGAHYGFFNSIVNLKNKFPDYQMLVAWDSSSKRREEESSKGVELGIIKERYKANRKKDEPPKQLKDWFETGHHLKNALGKTGIPQIRIEGYEADDVIASYCYKLKKDNNIIIVTSDKDFYQLLDDNVIIWDGMKLDYITKKSFQEEFKINPEQHVDVGALMGDNGDNIFGIPGWGDKTALSSIEQYGSWKNVINDLETKYSKYREEYPDFSDEGEKKVLKDGDSLDWKKAFQTEFLTKKTEKKNYVYPEIYWGQPWSGLLVGFESKKIKISKRDLMALMFEDRVKLAYSLKKMDTNIPNLPDIETLDKDKNKLLEYFQYYDIISLVDKIDIFF